MISIAERIYQARNRWKCSFEQLSFVLDLPKEEVIALYKLEYDKNHTISRQITLNDTIDDLNLSTRTRNLLHRRSILTIKELLTAPKSKIKGKGGCGNKTLEEIDATISEIVSVLNLRVPDLMMMFTSPGIIVEIYPYSYENTKKVLPLDLRNTKDDYEYSRLLNTKRVISFTIAKTEIKPVVNIFGKTVGYSQNISLAVWMHDHEGDPDRA